MNDRTKVYKIPQKPIAEISNVINKNDPNEEIKWRIVDNIITINRDKIGNAIIEIEFIAGIGTDCIPQMIKIPFYNILHICMKIEQFLIQMQM